MADDPGHLNTAMDDAAGITTAGPVDLDALRTATLRQDPWAYAVVPGTIGDADALRGLVDTYPTSGFKEIRQGGVPDGPIIEVRNDMSLDDLPHPTAWQDLIDQLTGAEYRAVMQNLTGLDLGHAVLRLAFYRYPPSYWLRPHRDNELKLISHIFYANPVWPEQFGGRLLIHRRDDATDRYATISPVAGTSVIIVRGDTSWHSVEPVSADCPYTRRSFVAHFYQPGSDVDFYDR